MRPPHGQGTVEFSMKAATSSCALVVAPMTPGHLAPSASGGEEESVVAVSYESSPRPRKRAAFMLADEGGEECFVELKNFRQLEKHQITGTDHSSRNDPRILHRSVSFIGGRDGRDRNIHSGNNDCVTVVTAIEDEFEAHNNVEEEISANREQVAVASAAEPHERRDFKRVKCEPSPVALDEPHREEHCHPELEERENEEDASAIIDDSSSKPRAPKPKFGTPPHPDACDPNMDPDTFVQLTVRAYLGFAPRIRPALSLPEDFFPPISEEHLASYGVEVVAAVRENDLDSVRALHSAGRSLSCCNRFGESLIHMACRRGHSSVARYLLEDAGVGTRIRDDCGRSPLHDACWNREPQYEIVDMLLRRDPALLLVSDKRGHTPFAYARREHWPLWRRFLFDKTSYIVDGMGGKGVAEIFAEAT